MIRRAEFYRFARLPLGCLTCGVLLMLIVPAISFARDTELLRRAVAVRPHRRQLAWQELEFIAFVHFGVNTFRGVEWGNGLEDPAIFQPLSLDAEQWVRTAKDAGMKLIMLTVKHHDGFCLWQTRYTKHSVASSPWRSGRGDVLRDLTRACAKHGVKVGVYLSPADLYQIENPAGLYGNGSQYSTRVIPRPVDERPFPADSPTFEYRVDDYNEYFLNQLYELLTEYGPIHEVWFDGAHPKRKGNQQYTYEHWYDMIRQLVPQAVIAIKGPDVRWCGNEAGATRPSEWSVIPLGDDPDHWEWPDLTTQDLGSLEELAKAKYLHWYPAETNTSLRHGWFWRDEQQRVKSAQEILDVWYRSVGGNSVFLLNMTPDRRGLIPERDCAVLHDVGQALRRTFATDLAKGSKAEASTTRATGDYRADHVLDGNPGTCWMTDDGVETAELTVQLPQPTTFDVAVLQESIGQHGQRIESFGLDVWRDAAWSQVAQGTIVGYKRICRFPTVRAERVRIRITGSRLCPTISHFGLYRQNPPPAQTAP